MRTTLAGREAYNAWLRTVERVSLTPAGHAVVERMDQNLDGGWSVADDTRYWLGRRRHHLMVALVERAAKRGDMA